MIVAATDCDLGEINTAKMIGEWLHEAYPGHLWAVSVKQGVVRIWNYRISTRWGMQFKLTEQYSNSILKANALEFCGEFLERCNMPRGASEGVRARVLDGARRFSHLEGIGA